MLHGAERFLACRSGALPPGFDLDPLPAIEADDMLADADDLFLQRRDAVSHRGIGRCDGIAVWRKQLQQPFGRSHEGRRS